MSEGSTYRWDARAYEDLARFVPQGGVPLLDLLAPAPGERVLDLGCGTGSLTRAIADRGAHVLGVDASADMIAEARRAHPDIEFMVARGETLPFDGEFDALFSNAALHWMAEAERVARSMLRALRPGGRLVAELGGHGCIATLLAAIDGALADLVAGARAEAAPIGGASFGSDLARFRPYRPWMFPRLGAYASLLEQVGFDVRAASTFERPTPVPDGPHASGLSAWLGLFASDLLAAVGEERRQRFVDAVERRCRPSLFRDGTWWLDYVRLRVVATKNPSQ